METSMFRYFSRNIDVSMFWRTQHRCKNIDVFPQNIDVYRTSMNIDHPQVVFDTTPIMSTYLVAVVVGEYDYVEDKSSDGVLVRVYTPVGKKE